MKKVRKTIERDILHRQRKIESKLRRYVNSLASIEVGIYRWLGFQAPLRFEEVDYIWPPDQFWKERLS